MFKEINNDVLIIFKVYVYLVVIFEKKIDRKIFGKYNIEIIVVLFWNDLWIEYWDWNKN